MAKCLYCGLNKPVDVDPWERCSRCGKPTKLSVGDRVWYKTIEPAVLVREWDRDDNDYDWWVDVYYLVDGKEGVCTIPAKTDELLVRTETIEEWRERQVSE